MKIKKQYRHGRKPCGYYVEGERVSNFTFKIHETLFHGDQVLFSIYNNITRERFFSCKFWLVAVPFKDFEIKCLDHGNYFFIKELSINEFKAIVDFEYKEFLKRK